MERTFWLHSCGFREHSLENDMLPEGKGKDDFGVSSAAEWLQCGISTYNILPNNKLFGEIIQDTIR
jgi:hypothetical protein